MPTVIDELVVTLGLDPKNFTQGQREAVDAAKKTQEQLEQGAKNTEDATRRVSMSINDLRRTAVDMFALFSGGKGVVDFVSGIVKADASVGRLSRSLGTSATDIAKWQAVSRMFGGDAQSMAASFTSMTDAFTGFKLGQMSQTVADLRAISTAGGILISPDDSTTEKFLKLSENMKNIYNQGPDGQARAGYLGRRLGLDPAMIDIMIQGRDKASEFLKYVETIGVATNKATENAQALERQWAEISLKNEATTRVVMDSWIGRVIKGMNAGAASDMEALANIGNDPLGSLKKLFSRDATATPSPTPAYGGGGGAFTSSAEREAFIRQEAVKNKIDPDWAVRVSKTEGFYGFKSSIPGENSYGAFQLNYSKNPNKPSLGDMFTRDTGLHASDPANERAGISYSLRHAATSGRGWADWYGARNNGIGQFAGIGTGGGGGGQTVNIDKVEIKTNATDGRQLAQDFKSEMLTRQSANGHANQGQE